ncbi:MAG: hypothetical protein HY890_02345 [Deltaproteobacteria bacterium]|nr:hypothetical protein [Deltaproteobacteria bacterium]
MGGGDYTKRLENCVKQMLEPIKDVPFNLVVETLSGKKVLPFDFKSVVDKKLLNALEKVAVIAGRLINKKGIVSKRANEVGNYIEEHVKEALGRLSLKPGVPSGKSGRKKAAGYPDILFWLDDKPAYLECKTYNVENLDTTQRSFYFSPSDDFKVVYDAHHFVISYEMYVSGTKNRTDVYKAKNWKILSLETLSVDVKHEFNSDNKRLYSGKDGALLLKEGEV